MGSSSPAGTVGNLGTTELDVILESNGKSLLVQHFQMRKYLPILPAKVVVLGKLVLGKSMLIQHSQMRKLHMMNQLYPR